MFAPLDADLVALALNASGGNVELALNALLVYAEKQENAAPSPNQSATGGEIEVDVINNARARVKLTFKYEQKVQDVIEAIKQQEGWGSNGRLFHNYSNGAFYIITNLSQDPSLPLCKYQKGSCRDLIFIPFSSGTWLGTLSKSSMASSR